MDQQQFYQRLRIKEIIEEVKDFKTFVFEDNHSISYKAGQYLTLVRKIAGEEVRRSYSITSSPLLKEPLSIGVKRVDNGIFSRVLIDDARPGDEIVSTGSGGFFVLPDNIGTYTQLFFLAAGSGITPVLSLLKTVLYFYPHLTVVLVYSNASVYKAAYLTAIQTLHNLFPSRFKLELLFSNAPDLSRARLHRDLLLSFLQQYAGTGKEKTLFYTCGPESYMRLCTYTLQEAGIASEQIRKENFFGGSAVKLVASPPDTNTHTVHLFFRSHQHSLPVKYPDSILKAAKKAGLLLPYSCEAGRCGNCVATCISGKIWHSYNEVLTDKELAKGLVLTCVGHPVGGDAEIEL